MGFFGGIDQPGPGVYLDDPQEGPVVSFFRMYGTKFFSLCLFNIIFVVVNIPALLICGLVGGYLLPIIIPLLSIDKLTEAIPLLATDALSDPTEIAEAADQLYWILIILASFVMTGMLLIVFGPLQAALSYVYRNFARGNASGYWNDFLKAFKENWKQSLVSSIISTIITVILLFDISFVAIFFTGSTGSIIAVIIAVLLFFFMCIQMYVYPMIVSLELPLRKIYKNALIFTIVRLLPTLGIIAVQLVVVLVIPFLLVSFASGIGMSIAIVYYLSIAFAFAHFLGNYFAWYQIEKYIVAPQQNTEVDADNK